MDILSKTKALRDEAWQAVESSAAYKAFKGLDDAVKAMSGESVDTAPQVARAPRKRSANGTKRVSQADVAEKVLHEVGEPLPVGRWLEACVNKGLIIGGSDPLGNFRSMASRDDRFYNFTRNNMYFWWLTGVDLPEAFMPEPEDNSDLWGSGNNTSQKGGDGHAANNT
jgi:hypothetical protein